MSGTELLAYGPDRDGILADLKAHLLTVAENELRRLHGERSWNFMNPENRKPLVKAKRDELHQPYTQMDDRTLLAEARKTLEVADNDVKGVDAAGAALANPAPVVQPPQPQVNVGPPQPEDEGEYLG